MELGTTPGGPQVTWGDDRLLRACLEGSEAAWVALVHKYKNLIFSVPIKHGLSREEAADIFQAVCLDLVKEMSRLREPRALPAWLSRVAAHKSLRWKRRRATQTRTSEPWGSPPVPVSALPDPAAMLSQIEQEQAIREAIRELPPRCQALVTMLLIESPPVPYSEVARKLGLARGSVGAIRRRCLDRLRRSLVSKGAL